MGYIVTKFTPRYECRIYVEGSDFEGDLIYRGHKLGLEKEILSEILDYRIERSNKNIYLLDYNKSEQWLSGRAEDLDSLLQKSWQSLQDKMTHEFGNFRKIIITKINI